MPLRQYIGYLCFKTFGKKRPDVVRSIEEKIRLDEAKKAQKRKANIKARQAGSVVERQS